MSGFFDQLIFIIIALIPAVTVHEWAHAFTAYKLGDPTAKNMGRMSFNPLVHLDTLGTLALIFFRFGWGKPVPVDPRNFKQPMRDQALVAFAGPLSNILFAAVLIFALKYFINPYTTLGVILYMMMQINVILAVFNLLPIYPLDGSKILLFFFKGHQRQLMKFYQYSPSILLGLLFADFLLRITTGFSIFGYVFGNISNALQALIYSAT